MNRNYPDGVLLGIDLDDITHIRTVSGEEYKVGNDLDLKRAEFGMYVTFHCDNGLGFKASIPVTRIECVIASDFES